MTAVEKTATNVNTRNVNSSKYPIWKQLCLGGSSCAVATTFTHPIDTVKLRIQLQGSFSTTSANSRRYTGMLSAFYHVTRDEGLRALYFGMSPAILRAATYSATRLGMYEPLRSALTERSGKNDASLSIKIAASVSSGALGAFVGNPCELIKVRMQQGDTHQYRNVFDGIARIVRHEGFTSLWIGTYPAALRAALLTSSQLATYDQSKGMLKRFTGLEEGLSTHVGAAMIAGLATTTVSTPADVVKSVVMHSKERLHPMHCVRHIIEQEGFGGLMRGWTANYARLGPHTLITVVAFENLRTFFGWKNL